MGGNWLKENIQILKTYEDDFGKIVISVDRKSENRGDMYLDLAKILLNNYHKEATS
jgi:hypothetical protein